METETDSTFSFRYLFLVMPYYQGLKYHNIYQYRPIINGIGIGNTRHVISAISVGVYGKCILCIGYRESLYNMCDTYWYWLN